MNKLKIDKYWPSVRMAKDRKDRKFGRKGYLMSLLMVCNEGMTRFSANCQQGFVETWDFPHGQFGILRPLNH